MISLICEIEETKQKKVTNSRLLNIENKLGDVREEVGEEIVKDIKRTIIK